MLAKRIIPCLDVRNGRVVKGTNFKDLSDVDSPVALAERYSECGADELVFYDITASCENRSLFTDILKETASFFRCNKLLSVIEIKVKLISFLIYKSIAKQTQIFSRVKQMITFVFFVIEKPIKCILLSGFNRKISATLIHKRKEVNRINPITPGSQIKDFAEFYFFKYQDTFFI